MNYVAYVKSVLPNGKERLPDPIPRAYVGVSLEQEAFHGDRLRAVLVWLEMHTEQCWLVIGDDLHRHTHRIWTVCDEARALESARRIGDQVERELFVHRTNLTAGRFSVSRWAELLANGGFASSRTEIAKLYNRDMVFAESIRKCAAAYLRRNIRRGRSLALPHNAAHEVATAYLMEELAVFTVIGTLGWCVEVYPGPELPVLREIAQGAYVDVPAPLRQRMNVELGLRAAKHAEGGI
jgi:tRNA-dependent cyclodipeptide synthase